MVRRSPSLAETRPAPERPPRNGQTREGAKGEATRERILGAAEAMVLAQGFGASSIEGIIAEAGITKSGFFYHFRDKTELARAMLRRYILANDRIFDDLDAQAEALADDPLDAFLIWLKLLAGVMADLPGTHPGCLIASICYEERQFDREVRRLAAEGVLGWNARFRATIEGIAAVHPLRGGMEAETLARMLSCVVDGGIIMARTLEDPQELARQILAYRSLVRLAFGRG